MPNPIDNAELYDHAIIGGVRTPGVLEIAGLARAEGWDAKDADGQDNASLSRKGKKLAKFTLRFHLLDDPWAGVDQFAEWDAFLPVLRSSFAGKDPQALTIEHPDTEECDVRAIVVEQIGQKQHDGNGAAVVDVSVIEYAPPAKKATKSPSGAKSKKGGEEAGTLDPNDPIVQATNELNALLDEPEPIGYGEGGEF